MGEARRLGHGRRPPPRADPPRPGDGPQPLPNGEPGALLPRLRAGGRLRGPRGDEPHRRPRRRVLGADGAARGGGGPRDSPAETCAAARRGARSHDGVPRRLRAARNRRPARRRAARRRLPRRLPADEARRAGLDRRDEGPSLVGLERLSRDASLAALLLLGPVARARARRSRCATTSRVRGSLVELALAAIQFGLALAAFLVWWRSPRRGALAARLNVVATLARGHRLRVGPPRSSPGSGADRWTSSRSASTTTRRRSTCASALRSRPTASRTSCARFAAEPWLSEVLVLSTCNRTEIYAVTDAPDGDGARAGDAAPPPARRARRRRQRATRGALGETAADHLFRVAAGLESAILGESEIQGQLKEAHRVGLEVRGRRPDARPPRGVGAAGGQAHAHRDAASAAAPSRTATPPTRPCAACSAGSSSGPCSSSAPARWRRSPRSR